MKPFYRNLKFIVVGVLTFIGLSISSITAQTSITQIGQYYDTNFDANPNFPNWTTNTSISFTNGTTISNWYALTPSGTVPGTLRLNDGTLTTSGLTLFGTSESSERALGFVHSSVIGYSYYGWRLKNETGRTIKGFKLEWDFEQWRKTTQANLTADVVYFISSNPIESIVEGSLKGTTISLTSNQQGTAEAINGNVFKQTSISSLNEQIENNQEIIICWRINRQSNPQQVAIDNVRFRAKSDQSINFAPIGSKTLGDSQFTLSTTVSSGLPVTYTSSDESVASISGNTVTIHKMGITTITASQAGDDDFNPATSNQTLRVGPRTPVVTKATDINSDSFTANWVVDNGSQESNVRYTVEYSTIGFDNDEVTPDGIEEIVGKTQNVSSLTPNSIYYYRVQAVFNSQIQSGYTTAATITTGDDYRSNGNGEWTGSNLWTVKSGLNWVVSPTNAIANSIEIAHLCSISSGGPITTNSLLIRSGAKLTTTQQIHVTNELIIEVDADGIAGQILNTNNNIIIGSNAKITVRKAFKSGEWSFIGFPFTVNAADVHIANTETTLTWGDLNSGANYIVQEYDGDARARLTLGNPNYTGSGVYWKNVSPKVFTAKKGYIVYNNTGNVIDFTSTGSNIGTFFSRTGASVTTGKYASTSEHRDWNLIAMPLSSKYNLANATSTSYYTYNGINYLPALAGESLDVQPFSAFFVQAPTTSISFANGGRKVATASRIDEKPVDEIYLNLSNGNSTYDDVTRIRLQEGASAGYEIGTDAVKMFGLNPNVSYIYTAINNTTASINTLPRTVSEVELNTKFASSGKYSISISNLEKVQSYSAVILVDKVTGKRTDLLSTGSYEYSVGSAGTANRFKVQFAPKITTGVSVSGDYSLQITSQNGNAYISGLSTKAQVRVYDTTGKVVYNGIVNNIEPIRFENKGLYVFEIATPDKTENIKAFVR